MRSRGGCRRGAVKGHCGAAGRGEDAQPRLCSMDWIDEKILDVLQHDATVSIAEIGQKVGLSQTPCWKRIQRLEADGVIERRVALLNPEKLGFGLTVFVSIETADHSREWLARFAATVSGMPEVLEFYRMAGDVDYMLRVVVTDMTAYDSFYKRLIEAVPLKNVTSRFAMERVKATTVLPIAVARAGKIAAANESVRSGE
jgi:Lrp/AsnC family transcriptional regulator